MPSRSARGRPMPVKRSTPSETPPMQDSPSMGLKNLLSTLNKEGLLKELSRKESLSRQPEPIKTPEEVIEDPKISIIKNPPMELRKMLRKLKIDKEDLKTLLDIPLPIISEQNVLALIKQKKLDTNLDHVDQKDPAKLINLLKMYLTPPNEDDNGESKSFLINSPPTLSLEKPTEDVDEIYKNIEFRNILTDCIALFQEGKTVMDELYKSVEKSNKVTTGQAGSF